jgi:hypothetical protein
MASGHANRANRPNMAAPTKAAHVKKALANGSRPNMAHSGLFELARLTSAFGGGAATPINQWLYGFTA